MMAGITERNQMKNELAGMGYSLRYIDEWQPKTRLYRHKAAYNVDGVIMEGVGTYVDNVPGNPDYVMKKSRIGLFGWPPSGACTCRWCAERNKEKEPVAQAVGATPDPVLSQARGKRRMGPHYKAS